MASTIFYDPYYRSHLPYYYGKGSLYLLHNATRVEAVAAFVAATEAAVLLMTRWWRCRWCVEGICLRRSGRSARPSASARRYSSSRRKLPFVAHPLMRRWQLGGLKEGAFQGYPAASFPPSPKIQRVSSSASESNLLVVTFDANRKVRSAIKIIEDGDEDDE
ncbi:hypothetical protein HZH66_002183 [Vespula vulgaris]|uniref:Uncharacterized protein n=1 Tax=Vespula vulgaris TaxID=7454 RepID=A0A834KIX9_VESVU|nr:hypothetical protein HZH66_002183 [Vespula vulgaris]